MRGSDRCARQDAAGLQAKDDRGKRKSTDIKFVGEKGNQEAASQCGEFEESLVSKLELHALHDACSWQATWHPSPSRWLLLRSSSLEPVVEVQDRRLSKSTQLWNFGRNSSITLLGLVYLRVDLYSYGKLKALGPPTSKPRFVIQMG